MLARETSGYHQIETLFIRVDLADTVTVRVHPGGGRRLDTGSADLGLPDRNLAMRAAVAYQEACGWPAGFHVTLDKAVPAGAGLGGGSADAGAVLRALNALAPTPVTEVELLAIGVSLGADVPFLTSEVPFALGWGRGERLLGLTAPPARDVVIVVPPFAVSTAEAYELISPRVAAGAPSAQLVAAGALSDWGMLVALAGNDFEREVAARNPEVGRIRDALLTSGAKLAQLTGSGSAVFGVFDRAPAIDALAFRVEGMVIPTRTAERVAPVELIE